MFCIWFTNKCGSANFRSRKIFYQLILTFFQFLFYLQNSIRHNLSLHNRFMRVQNEGTGKSSWWMLNPDAKPGNNLYVSKLISEIPHCVHKVCHTRREREGGALKLGCKIIWFGRTKFGVCQGPRQRLEGYVVCIFFTIAPKFSCRWSRGKKIVEIS